MGRVCLLNSTGTEVVQPASKTDIDTMSAKITACNTGAVVVSSSALPTGAATSAAQASLLAAVSGVKQVGTVTLNIEDFDYEGYAAGTRLTVTSIPCKYAIVRAPVTIATGLASNTKIVLVGASGTGNQQTVIHPSDFEGVPIPCTNLNELYILTAADNNGVVAIAYGVPS